jgi:hypothetical protein
VTTNVAWPAVLKYASKDVLLVVDTLDEWMLDPELHAHVYKPEDRLIDSNGTEYRLGIGIEPTGVQVTAHEFEEMAAHHLVAVGAPPEWLTAHLHDMPESQHIRAGVLYIARLARRQASEGGGDGADEPEASE